MFSTWLSNRSKPLTSVKLCATPAVEALEHRELLSASPLGPEFIANGSAPAVFDFLSESQGGPPKVAVATDADGNFVVVWSSAVSSESFPETSDIYARLFDALGNPLSDAFPVNTEFAGANPFEEGTSVPSVDVDMTSDGDFVIVWSQYKRVGESLESNVIGQLYDEDGNPVGDNFQIDPLDFQMTGPLDAYRPRVSINEDETFAVAYVADDTTESLLDGLLLQRFNADGKPFGDPIVVNGGNDVGFGFGLSGDGAGTYLLVWDEQGVELDPDRILAVRFDGGLTDVITIAISPSVTSAPDVAFAVDDNSAVAVWNETIAGEDGVAAQLFSSELELDGVPFPVNQSDVSGFLQPPHVGSSPDGAIRVVWVEGQSQSVTVVTFAPGGILDQPNFTVNSSSFHYSGGNPAVDTSDIAVDANGNFVIVYSGVLNSSSLLPGYIFARIFRDTTTNTPLNPSDFLVATEVDLSFLAVRLNQNFEQFRFPERLPPGERVAGLLSPFSGPRFEGFRPVFEESFRTVGGVSAIGQISGKIFEDLNGNGVQDAGESGMPGIFVFLDMNKNGRWDDEEPFELSDVNGDYLFESLRLDRYLVVQDLEKINVEQTAPPDRRANEITLSEAQPKRQEVNFGDKQFAVAKPPPFVGPIEPKKTPGTKPPGMTESKDPKDPTPSKPPPNAPPNEE